MHPFFLDAQLGTSNRMPYFEEEELRADPELFEVAGAVGYQYLEDKPPARGFAASGNDAHSTVYTAHRPDNGRDNEATRREVHVNELSEPTDVVQFDDTSGVPAPALKADTNFAMDPRDHAAGILNSLVFAQIETPSTHPVLDDFAPMVRGLPSGFMTPVPSPHPKAEILGTPQIRSFGGDQAEGDMEDEETDRHTAQTSFSHPSSHISSRVNNTASAVPEVLILRFAGRERLLSKPDNYADLLASTRSIFKELKDVDDAEITFRFVPDWHDREVELDHSAFEHIHNRAVLHIVPPPVRNSAPARRQGTKRPEPDAGQELVKRVKTERDSTETVVDLTGSDSETIPVPQRQQTHVEHTQARFESPLSSAPSSPEVSGEVLDARADQTAAPQYIPLDDGFPCMPCWTRLCANGKIPFCEKGDRGTACQACKAAHTKCSRERAGFEASPALLHAATVLLAEVTDAKHIIAPVASKDGDMLERGPMLSASFTRAVDQFSHALELSTLNEYKIAAYGISCVACAKSGIAGRSDGVCRPGRHPGGACALCAAQHRTCVSAPVAARAVVAEFKRARDNGFGSVNEKRRTISAARGALLSALQEDDEGEEDEEESAWARYDKDDDDAYDYDDEQETAEARATQELLNNDEAKGAMAPTAGTRARAGIRRVPCRCCARQQAHQGSLEACYDQASSLAKSCARCNKRRLRCLVVPPVAESDVCVLENLCNQVRNGGQVSVWKLKAARGRARGALAVMSSLDAAHLLGACEDLNL